MNYAFEPHAIPNVPVRGSDHVVPVHRIYCIGRNYAAHTIEMGHDPNRDPPIFFQKNPGTLIMSGGEFPYPAQSRDVHFEIELVVALGSGGVNIAKERALECVFGYGVGLDMTRRDRQKDAKQTGGPWEVAKAFEHAAPCTEIVPASEIGHPDRGRIWLEQNGEMRQDSDLTQMIWTVPQIIAHLSRFFTLRSGDLIYSGTPAGVGPTQPGDRLRGGVAGVAELEIRVV